MRVGLDGVMGHIAGGADAWIASALPTAHITTVTARDLDARLKRGDRTLVLLDVRTRAEWTAEHIAGSVNVPVGELVNRLAEVRSEGMVATLCETGYRSALAASILARAGVDPVGFVTGGMTAFRQLAH
jgi:hydroxyacylglutathione hydrolase